MDYINSGASSAGDKSYFSAVIDQALAKLFQTFPMGASFPQEYLQSGCEAALPWWLPYG